MVTAAEGAKAVELTPWSAATASRRRKANTRALPLPAPPSRRTPHCCPGPRPTDQACTQQYGGPQKATVTGSVDGKAVESKFSRTDGCEIAAWDAAKDVLGSSGGA